MTLLGANALVVGGVDSARVGAADDAIGRSLECDNVVVWICGTDKAIPLAFP